MAFSEKAPAFVTLCVVALSCSDSGGNGDGPSGGGAGIGSGASVGAGAGPGGVAGAGGSSLGATGSGAAGAGVGAAGMGVGGEATGVGGVAAGGGTAGAGAAGAAASGGAGGTGPSGIITLYEECGQVGASVSLDAGQYNAAALQAAGISVDTISSFWLTNGYRVTLYLEDDFQGQSSTLTAGSLCLPDLLNDQIGSLIVESATIDPGMGGASGAGQGGTGPVVDPADPGIATCAGDQQLDRGCAEGHAFVSTKYWVNNNLWGDGAQTQCLWRRCSSGDVVGWGTDWSHPANPAGVKSYTSAVQGWHWGNRSQGTGLPAQISSLPNFNCGWSYDVNVTSGTINVAYDLWVHDMQNPGTNDDPSDEIMIWLYASEGARTISSTGVPIATVNIGGTNWALYQGEIAGLWNVFTFKRFTSSLGMNLNLTDFIDDLTGRGLLSGSKYLTSIQAGNEVFDGQGELTVNGFGCQVQ